MERRSFLSWAAASAALGVTPFRRWGLGWASAQDGATFREMTPEQAEAVRKALEWLARNQGRMGAVGQTCQVAFTSIGGLAFLAGGNTPTRGKYAANVRNALRFVLRCCRRDGYINEGGMRGAGGSGMHGHGYALLFLSELYGMCGDVREESDLEESLKEAIARAVKLTASAQDPSGGWTYEPNPYGHEGSVTITQVQALRAARNAGFTVPRETIDRGISYIKKSTASDGSVMYSLGQGAGGSYALTAAGACVYAYYGLYDAPEAKRCMKCLFEFITNKRADRNQHDYYAAFYAGQACFFMKQQDSRFWSDGYERIRKELMSSQDKKSGGWLGDSYNGAFGTACAALVLQIPYRYLPIFQD
ncbi:MAG: terpene cyclase/mutase family protein [Planctomycetes bacterium]|nr:terpene cyclase/mutase family protein [Planctomycetota bacterium]